jgi:hydrogenase nickel incorporation protein HypB
MSDSFRILEIKESVFEDNNREAAKLREELRRSGTFLLNLMSSPGSGKTTTVVRTIEALKNELHIGVVEADVDSDVDARTVAASGAKVIQVHTGGMCHMDANMTSMGLHGMDIAGLDFVILENIGNLLCPAEFDTGASKNAMILSVPEGDDKPLKYPLMFSIVDVLLVNKIDAISFFDFNMEALRERVTKLNPKVKIIPISAKTGEGIAEWADWVRTEVKNWQQK